MNALSTANGVKIKNVLFATDFSDASDNALTCALSIVRAYDATLHALHVVTPQAFRCAQPETAAAFEALQDVAQQEMEKVAARISGVRNETTIEHAASIWPAIEQVIRRDHIDLLVIGTHGRTGMRKLLLGSTAESIFRRARVPVLTIGPAVTQGMHGAAKYRSVLLATDLQEDSLSAAAFAFSMAEGSGANLTLFHAVSKRTRRAGAKPDPAGKHSSAANILNELHDLIPVDADLWCRPKVVLKFGDPVRLILDTAKENHADLIVMGTHRAEPHPAMAAHSERGVSYNVVVRSRCPVLTVRG